MSLEVRVPALPESVTDARVLTWSKGPGEVVREGEPLVELETDKVILEVPSPRAGVLREILAEEGARVQADEVLALIDEGAVSALPGATPTPPAASQPTKSPTPLAEEGLGEGGPQTGASPHLTPSARQLVRELHLDPSQIPSRDGRIQKADVLAYLDAREGQVPERHPDLAATRSAPGADPQPPESTGETATGPRPERRVPMTRLRARIAERLLQAQQNAAMLTTFNEVDLECGSTPCVRRYRETFRAGVTACGWG
jgi:Pyruvate/2-oxoglutarate dehydrogenase complex, dihydrolipoamide acyltransferase (E2) component, and related enzymes